MYFDISLRFVFRLEFVKLRNDTTRLRTFDLTVINMISSVVVVLITVVKVRYRSFVCCGVLLYTNKYVCTLS